MSTGAKMEELNVKPRSSATASNPEPELPALVETHLLGTTLDLYGKTLEVRFVKRLREERRFNGIEDRKSVV